MSKPIHNAAPLALPELHPVWQRFSHLQQRCLEWFTNQAMPLWSTAGTDLQRGGFFEKLDPRGLGMEAPRRTRVVSRQLYVLSVANRLGWQGDVPALTEHGLAFLLERLRQRDGTFASAVLPDGKVADPRFDLYEQAFALFALACVCMAAPDRQGQLESIARELMARLRTHWKHPSLGFEEANPRSLPLRSNPHMHLLEATLQWEVCGGADIAAWRALSDEIVQLALTSLIDSHSGLVTELFDGDWAPAPGSEGTLAEPGHQFEWGWLLTRWGLSRQHTGAMEAGRRMIMLAEQHGIDPVRGVAVNSFGTDLQQRDRDAKLWPQTERIKAWALLASIAPSEEEAEAHLSHCTKAIEGLLHYLKYPVEGAWHEVWRADGSWSDEDVRASSFYHIVCALESIHALSAREPHQ